MNPNHANDNGLTEVPPTGRRRCLPIGLIGMLAVIAVVESGLGRLDRALTPLGSACWREAGEAAGSVAVGADVLCLGDSLIKIGVMPVLIEERLGLSAYNLAVFGGTSQASFVLLRRALDSGARPRAIVIDAEASLLMWNSPRTNFREWSELGRVRDIVEIAIAERDPGFLLLYAIQRGLHSARLRPEIRSAIVAVLVRKPPRIGPSELDVLQQQTSTNRGGFLNPFRAGKVHDTTQPDGEVPTVDLALYYPPNWAPRQQNAHYLERFLRLAESRGIDVFFVLPPIDPGLQAELERRGVAENPIKVVRYLSRRFPRLTVVDGRHAGYLRGNFIDPQHLDRAGATSFSRGLARVIGDRLSSTGDRSRWVALPNHHGPDDDPRLEDSNQSRVVLQGLGAVRR